MFKFPRKSLVKHKHDTFTNCFYQITHFSEQIFIISYHIELISAMMLIEYDLHM